jgi:hypothetical protein
VGLWDSRRTREIQKCILTSGLISDALRVAAGSTNYLSSKTDHRVIKGRSGHYHGQMRQSLARPKVSIAIFPRLVSGRVSVKQRDIIYQVASHIQVASRLGG